jgi:hypothetical protein
LSVPGTGLTSTQDTPLLRRARMSLNPTTPTALLTGARLASEHGHAESALGVTGLDLDDADTR